MDLSARQMRFYKLQRSHTVKYGTRPAERPLPFSSSSSATVHGSVSLPHYRTFCLLAMSHVVLITSINLKFFRFLVQFVKK